MQADRRGRLGTADTRGQVTERKARSCSGNGETFTAESVSAEAKSQLRRRQKAKAEAQRLLAVELFPGREHTGHLRSSSRRRASRQAGRKLQ